MEVYQVLDFSSNAGHMATMLPHSPASPPAHQDRPSVLDLCVRRSSPTTSPVSSPARMSPRSPSSPRSPLYHPYLNNNNSKAVNHNDIKPAVRPKMEMDYQTSLPSPPAYPHAELPDANQMSAVPPMSVLQQRLLPRSATSAFAPCSTASGMSAGMPTVPAPRRRRTSSGLPDSPLGSSDDRSSTAASPSPSPPSMDILGPLGHLGGLPGLHYAAPTALPTALPTTSPTGSLPLGTPHQVSPASPASTASRNGKPTRPFKAYPKDPLSLTAGVQVGGVTLGAAEAALGRASNEAYAEFRRRMLAQVQAAMPSSANKARNKDARPPSPTQQQPADSLTHGETTPAGAADSSNASSPESGAGGDSKDGKDAAYWERRRKNNEAAKRSRDARRAKEDEIAIRAAFLEQENLKLKYEVAALRNETAKLRCMLYQGATEC
ncbi:protein giant [Thrips palmi]|uniref:Protein giant n=1 Tax=Thrips palmi TaxID=161013 RepID=A0A6P8YDH4_THRPL|nr:protein giant [Thrips palmi]